MYRLATLCIRRLKLFSWNEYVENVPAFNGVGVGVYRILYAFSVFLSARLRIWDGGSSGMEMYDVSETRNTNAYLIEGNDLNSHLKSPNFEQFEAMFNEGAPEFVVDQNLYYPAATNYGYYCTAFDSPAEWEDNHRIFGVDGPDIQYTGAQNGSFPYVYYTPSYGFAQSPYNPYNPYIPGAMIGVDGSYGGAQQYYSLRNNQNLVSSPAYIPLVQPDSFPDSSVDSLFDNSASVSRPDGRGLKHKFNSASRAFSRHSSKSLSNQTSSLSRVSEGPRANAGVKKGLTDGSDSGSAFLNLASPPVQQGTPAGNVLEVRSVDSSIQPVDINSYGNVSAHHNQLKIAPPLSNGFSDYGSNANGQPAVTKLRPKVSKVPSDVNGGSDVLGRISLLTMKTQSFFVIKSYSEDDVHKSIKYNVWSSTPHGNKKLQSAYEDARRIALGKSGGCPIFLFFSVNASGQFCGVAEMVGPVDFNKDMDFWQQDKWNGSFPVKWHLIKDVPNANFRHIILENNENKPVTNSRDTQEIMFRKGLEMLKIFKHHTMKTSLLDDFMYYENRQKIMQEEKAKFLIKRFECPILVSALEPPQKLNFVSDIPSINDEENLKMGDEFDCFKQTSISSTEHIVNSSDVPSTTSVHEEAEKSKVDREDISSVLKIGSVTITPKRVETKLSGNSVANKEPIDVLTVGSMQVKVNGFAESSGFLKVGSIPLDPRALQLDKGGNCV
ncbi:YTH domain [Sesbania bispinosa]|nr:YTH domain [Sesbania bispinosa]